MPSNFPEKVIFKLKSECTNSPTERSRQCKKGVSEKYIGWLRVKRFCRPADKYLVVWRGLDNSLLFVFFFSQHLIKKKKKIMSEEPHSATILSETRPPIQQHVNYIL
jgi:hypothetical protein